MTNVGTSAFSGCVCLTSLEIPDGVISIGSAAFLGCAGLTSVTLPVSVKTVGENAFTGCGALTTVYYNVSETAFGRISVASGNEVILAAEVCFTHSFIRILLLPLKTVYAVGEEFEPAGIAAALFYDDSSVSLTSRLGYSGFDSSSPGTKTVMASYGGVQTEFEVTVTGSADPVEPDPVRSDPVEPDPAGDAPRIVVDSVTCQPGAGEVEVALRVENDPGFFALLLKPDFAVGIEYLGFNEPAGISGFGAVTDSNINLMAIAMADIEGDQTILTLIFDVPQDIPYGEYAINFVYLSGNDYDENLLDFEIVPGAVIIEPLYGDMDGNGTVDSIDLTLLREYLTDPDNTSVSDGVDVNRDGAINTLDLTRLRKLLSVNA
ncbi:MAG: leucine-rich repeat protein [Clostridia bacterium]|nr:leucine-rich repeat protein [Clostridia bacterium]